MSRNPWFVALFCLLAVCGCALAQEPAVASQPVSEIEKQWKPEDVVFAESAGQFRVSPDGKWAVWVKSVGDKEKDGRVSNLFLSSLTAKKEIQLTRGTDTYSSPRWSPNSELICFESTRPVPNAKPDFAKSQLWLINASGGEPWHLTEFERGVRSFEWVDNDTLIFSAEEDASLYERETKRKKDATRVVDDLAHTPLVRLFRLSIKDKKVTRLTANEDWIQSWAVSPDGKKAVTVHERSLSYEWDQKVPPVTFLYDLVTSQREQLFAGTRIRPGMLRWARDGSGFYLTTPYSSHPVFLEATITLPYFYDLAGGQAGQVNLDWENGLGFGF